MIVLTASQAASRLINRPHTSVIVRYSTSGIVAPNGQRIVLHSFKLNGRLMILYKDMIDFIKRCQKNGIKHIYFRRLHG